MGMNPKIIFVLGLWFSYFSRPGFLDPPILRTMPQLQSAVECTNYALVNAES